MARLGGVPLRQPHLLPCHGRGCEVRRACSFKVYIVPYFPQGMAVSGVHGRQHTCRPLKRVWLNGHREHSALATAVVQAMLPCIDSFANIVAQHCSPKIALCFSKLSGEAAGAHVSAS